MIALSMIAFVAQLAAATTSTAGAGFEPWTRDLGAEGPQRLVLAWPKERRIAVEVTATGSEVRVRLVDPDGRLRLSWSVPPDAPGTTSWVSDMPGRWALVVEATQAASCTLRVVENRKATPLDYLDWRAAQAADALVAGLTGGDLQRRRDLLLTVLEDYEAAYSGAPLDQVSRLEALATRVDGEGERKALAEILLRKALEVLTAAGGAESLDAARVTSALSDLRNDRGDWEGSEQLERKALAIRRRLLDGTDPAIALSLWGIASPLFQQGRFDESLALVDEALKIVPERRVDPVLYGDILDLRGEIQRTQGHYRAAEDTFRQAMTGLASTGEDADLLAALWNNLAGVFRDEARYDDARDCFRRAMEIWSQSGSDNPDRIATGLLNQAELLRLQGRIEDSVEFYDAALAKARATLEGSDPRLAIFISQKAAAEAGLGELGAAEALYQEALGVLEPSLGLDHPQSAELRFDRAGLLLSLGRPGEAEREYRGALSTRERFLGVAHPEVAVARAGLARSLAAQGADHDPEALILVDRALESFKETSAYPDAHAEALATKADIEDREGRREEALSSLGQALSLIESLRPANGGGDRTRAEFLGRYHHWFDTMIDWQVDAGRIDLALEFTERSRARVLLDQLAAAGVDLLNGLPEAQRRPLQERESLARVAVAQRQEDLRQAQFRTDLSESDRQRMEAGLLRQLEKAAREVQEAQHEIRRASPLWVSQVTAGGQTIDMAGAQKRIASASIPVVVYHVGSSRSQVLLLRGSGSKALAAPLVVDKQAADELGIPEGDLSSGDLQTVLADEGGLLDPSASSLRGLKRVEATAPSATRPLSSRLHALWRVLVPLRLWTEVAHAKEVVIVPDGALNRLPFEALVVRAGTNRQASRYWLDDGPALRYAPSLSVLDAVTQRTVTSHEGGRAIVLADPAFGAAGASWGLGLPQLPGTRREAAAIREAFDGLRPVVVLEGDDATESRLRGVLDAEARYLHFATHGLVDERTDDTLASLALTPPSAAVTSTLDDGRLQLFEIYDLKLSATLAVLSACDSQVGRTMAGEGVFALSRGFLAAGAQRVVASLWSVEDASTAELMRHFYGRIAKTERRGRSPVYAEELREAKRELRREARWSAPFFWAPFVLTGMH